MDLQRAMMAKIISEPEDDLPRLIYSDWLEEQGDPRCELIRLQCEIARRLHNRQEWRGLRLALDQLRQRHHENWVAALKPLAYHPLGFERGLLALFSCTADSFVKPEHQRVLAEQFPRLGCGKLWLWEKTARVQDLADSEALAWVPGFSWKNCRLSDDQLEILAASPRLFRLSLLELDQLHCSNRGITALAHSPGLPRLRKLVLKNMPAQTGLNGRGMAELVRHLPALEWLHLENLAACRLEEFLDAASSDLQRLESLTLAHPGPVPFAVLAECPHLTNLTRLEAFNTQVSAESLQCLIDNPAYARLQTFSFSHPFYEYPLDPALMRQLRQRFPLGYPEAPSAVE